MRKQIFILMMILSLLFLPIINILAIDTKAASMPVNPPDSGQNVSLPDDAQFDTTAWPMLAANPQRTSWTSTEVGGALNLAWYRPIEPYIPYKVQPIAANGKIYVSTARGLYAFNAANGDLAWVYPTEMPLGHSPTIATVNNKVVAFVGGYDRVVHAVDDSTGKDLAGYTPYVAGAGFETNPLVISNTIYAGNRDGYFYALNAATGSLIKRYKTDGPILYSAAYKNGVVYFASNDNYAYALNAGTLSLIWKSAKLPGSGFHSFWPVIYTEKSTGKDYVIFSGGENYRFSAKNLVNNETELIYKNNNIGNGNLIGTASTSISGDWVAGTTVINAKLITDYFEDRPYRRTIFVLNATNGQELTFDSDSDGKTEYAPFHWAGITHAGNKYPPVVNGKDGVYYQGTGYMRATDGWISRSGPVGWKFGTQYISRVSSVNFASDEPVAYASGGDLLYFALCCDRQAGAVDVSIPYGQSNREWFFYSYNLASNALAPGYQQMYNGGNATPYNNSDGWQVYSGKNQSKNGIYGKHGTTQSPPIPYQGKVYILKGNSLLAFSATGTNPKTPLAVAATQTKQNTITQPGSAEFVQKLETEVQKMIAAGPLRPGYYDSGFSDLYGMRGYSSSETSFGRIFDYFQNPADTVYTLLLAYPHLSAGTQQSVKTYLQTNYAPGKMYDFTKYTHAGWSNGASRESSVIPEDIWTDWNPTYSPTTNSDYPPFYFYAAWQYAKIVGNNNSAFAKSLFDPISAKLAAPLTDDVFIKKPYWLNQYIAGYYGYLQLQKLAGYSQNATVLSRYQAMLALRVNNFVKDTPYPPLGSGASNWEAGYNNTLAVARNFMFLTPELGAYLRQNALTKMQTALAEYESVGSYWFVAGFDDTYGEGTMQPLYDSPALFQAKAWILNESYNDLAQWLDVPFFARGDLFYIQNLAALLGAGDAPAPEPDFALSVTPDQQTVELGKGTTYAVQINPTGGYTGTVNLSAGGSPAGLNVKLSAANLRPPATTTLTVTDTHSASQNYLITVIAQDTKNTSLRYTSTVNFRVVDRYYKVYLPMVSRK